MGGAGGPVVVKLGGSFASSPYLRDWVDALAACAGRAVIVPGGGPFADAVRAAQVPIGFDEAAAHHMALLAMEQFGRALMSLDARLSDADSVDAIRHALAAGLVPVWMPTQMVLASPDIAPSWHVTSDSLAAWLAAKIGAGRLFLVKHVQLAPAPARCDVLAAAGIVDREFARHWRRSGVSACLLGPTDHAAAVIAIRDGAALGVALE